MLAWRLRILLAILAIACASFGAWVALAALGAIALLVAFSYAVAGLRPRADALGEYAVFSWLYLVAQPFPSAWVRHDSPDAPGRPVLLVHGFCCNRGVFWLLARRLRAAGYRVFTVDLEPLFAGIDEYARPLRDRIDGVLAASGEQDIPVICHSMGGLAMRACMRAHGARGISQFVTLGTPHNGTRLASLGFGRSARQMEPGSLWLRELAASEASQRLPPTTSIYSLDDSLVAPPSSSVLQGAANVELKGVGHMSLLCAKRVLPAILQGLRAPVAR